MVGKSKMTVGKSGTMVGKSETTVGKSGRTVGKSETTVGKSRVSIRLVVRLSKVFLRFFHRL